MTKRPRRRPRPTIHSTAAPVHRILAPGSLAIRFIVEEFSTPPIRDALVLGKRSGIGCVAMRKALAFMQTSPFAHIEFEDDTISDILARESVVRLIGRERLIKLVVEQVKPLMTAMDIMHLDIDARLHVEAEVCTSASTEGSGGV